MLDWVNITLYCALKSFTDSTPGYVGSAFGVTT